MCGVGRGRALVPQACGTSARLVRPRTLQRNATRARAAFTAPAQAAGVTLMQGASPPLLALVLVFSSDLDA